MTPYQFIQKWKRNTVKESGSSQEHFIDLCELLGQPTPNDVDHDGSWFKFQKMVNKDTGRKGFADVWRRDRFGWEYKGKWKSLEVAYSQLCQYRESLGNPPLLIVCDMERFQIHTNFTGTAKQVHQFDLDGLADPKNIAKLQAAFEAPEELKPGRTQLQVTEEVADKFATLAGELRRRGLAAERVAHFLVKVVFCMFAEDIGLLPDNVFLDTLREAKGESGELVAMLTDLFSKMDKGGRYGRHKILRFNGGLFRDQDVLPLTRTEIAHLVEAAECDWSAIEPSIIGTLFQRGLDPDKRSQIGAFYTSKEDIETLLQPVLVAPLRKEWEAMRAEAEALWPQVQVAAREKALATGRKEDRKLKDRSRVARGRFDDLIKDFLNRLSTAEVLDPACGSGNFLYVALQLLLELEKEVITYSRQRGAGSYVPLVGPTQLHGIEANNFAQELAQAVIWIGYLQWMRLNGFIEPTVPVLSPLDSIIHRDAVLDLSDPANPKEPDWPDAEFIIGNPPFLGGKMLRTNLGDEYVNALFKLWGKRVGGESDLVVYWFEKARAMIESGRVKRAGLLATQGIRGGANRDTLARIKETGDIFFAVSDRDWTLDGAAVHVSMVGFDNGTDKTRMLDGRAVATINANLSSAADITQAQRLAANAGIGFMGDTKGGPFDIKFADAIKLLRTPNVNGKPSSDVITPWCNGKDVTQRTREMWIIDFGTSMSEQEASGYEGAFEHVRTHVLPARQSNKRDSYRLKWWLHVEARSGMRRVLTPLTRFLVTPNVTKHRLFTWMSAPMLADHQLIAFGCSDDFSFGVLHSRVHEKWARSQGTQLREVESGFRYTPTTCFETFPFPEPTDNQRDAIAAAAKTLDALRNNWLNPPEWVRRELLEFPGSVDGPWKRFVVDADARGIGTVKYPRVVAEDGAAAGELKKRTLTNLYNARPQWLKTAHATLDAAVLAAYGWPADISDDELLTKLLELNLSRGGTTAAGDEDE